ncbi:MAG: hypothetical protein AABZ65_04325 [Candidatus Omnitrophota bacterium]
MHEVRCPACAKKVAEIARKPFFELSGILACHCGNKVSAKGSLDKTTGRIILFFDCPCGYQERKLAGYLVEVKCKTCKTLVRF